MSKIRRMSMLDQSTSVVRNISKGLTRVNTIQSVRLGDGARIIANRIVVDKETPIRWEITVTDPHYCPISVEQLPLEPLGERTRKHYLTRELFECAEAVGFIDWKQLPIGVRKSFMRVNGEVKKVHLSEYEAPDPTDYPLE
jgi:hypothetical protein